eukprot:scaffold10230_cov150-Amphora_coffeaeformis.AAC.4
MPCIKRPSCIDRARPPGYMFGAADFNLSHPPLLSSQRPRSCRFSFLRRIAADGKHKKKRQRHHVTRSDPNKDGIAVCQMSLNNNGANESGGKRHPMTRSDPKKDGTAVCQVPMVTRVTQLVDPISSPPSLGVVGSQP